MPASTTTTAPAVAATCLAGQLRIGQAGFAGAAGTIEATFSLNNSSSAPCRLSGFPGVVLLGPGEAPQPTVVVHGGNLAFEDIASSSVLLAPGATAYFNMGYSDVAPPCADATAAAITPPGTTTPAFVALSPHVTACDGGTVHVSAIFGAADRAATATTAPPAPS